jgi:hypothetical protein
VITAETCDPTGPAEACSSAKTHTTGGGPTTMAGQRPCCAMLALLLIGRVETQAASHFGIHGPGSGEAGSHLSDGLHCPLAGGQQWTRSDLRPSHIESAAWNDDYSGMSSVQRLLRTLSGLSAAKKNQKGASGKAQPAEPAAAASAPIRVEGELPRGAAEPYGVDVQVARKAPSARFTVAAPAVAADRQTSYAASVAYNRIAPGLMQLVIGVTCAIVGAAVSHVLSNRQQAIQRSRDDVRVNNVPDELVCPISQELMVDPVIVAETGQTYDRETITAWLHMHRTDPNTNCELRSKKLIPNVAVRKLVNRWKDQHPEYMHELGNRGGLAASAAETKVSGDKLSSK